MAETPYIQNMVATAINPTKWNVFAAEDAEGEKKKPEALDGALTGDAKSADMLAKISEED